MIGIRMLRRCPISSLLPNLTDAVYVFCCSLRTSSSLLHSLELAVPGPVSMSAIVNRMLCDWKENHIYLDQTPQRVRVGQNPGKV
jgi:hypothetical protein